MARIDWERICKSSNIPYESTPASRSRGYINVSCPLCGETEDGYHLGLHHNGWWTCYRNPIGHKGVDPRRVLALLLHCSYAVASGMIGGSDLDILSDFDEMALVFMSNNETVDQRLVLTLPDEFRLLNSSKGHARMYWRYLKGRGFKSVYHVSAQYNLHYCDLGSWRGRIIMPIYIDGDLVSWVGRTVYEDKEPRYKNLSHQEDAEPRAVTSVRDVLYNFDRAARTHHQVCVLVEGPFDAIKVDYYGARRGICAVATFGSRIGLAQMELLERIRSQCDNLVVCGDQHAEGNVMDILSATRSLGTRSIRLPNTIGDPGDLTKHQIYDLFSSL